MPAQRGQQLQRVDGPIQAQVLAHRQHQFLQIPLVHQVQGLLDGRAIALLPGGAMAELGGSAGPGGGAELGRGGRARRAVPGRHQGLGLLPEFFRQAAGCHLTAKGPLQPQPAVQALAAQLPAEQHRLHPGDGACGLLEGSIKEAKGQQHPGPGQGRTVLGGGEAAQAGACKALG